MSTRRVWSSRYALRAIGLTAALLVPAVLLAPAATDRASLAMPVSQSESGGAARLATHKTVSAEHPFVRARLRLRDGPDRRVVFRGWFQGQPVAAPEESGGLLRVMGGPGESDTGTVTLPAVHWDIRGKTLRYRDRKARSGGIRSVTVRPRADGGFIKITGGEQGWAYALDRPQSRVSVVLEIGSARWCTEFSDADLAQGGHRLRGRVLAPAAACDCVHVMTSTWQAIHTLVFQRHTCTSTACHGTPPGSGTLDLRAEAAYGELVNVPSRTDAAYLRVEPGAPLRSMLWRKVAARTLGLEIVPLSSMPIGDPAVEMNELAAIERWITAGAPEDGIVSGTSSLLGFCLPRD
jgi:hypothetical protein